MVSRTTVLFLLVVLGGCGAGSLGTPRDAGPTTGPACNGAASSSLPGVTLAFPDDRCSYSQGEVAVGIQILYQVVVAQDLTGVHPQPGDAGGCAQPGPSGLTMGFSLGGGGQSYCVCDTGLCAPQSPVTSPAAGSYPAQIAWDGRNWSGPSDTGNPKGAAFPSGTYTLTLTARGTWDNAGAAPGDGGPGGSADFAVTATRALTITPEPLDLASP